MNRRVFQRVPDMLDGGGEDDTSGNNADVSNAANKRSPSKMYTQEQVQEELNAHLQIHAGGLLMGRKFEETHNPYDFSSKGCLSPGKDMKEKGTTPRNRDDGHKTSSKIPVVSACNKKRNTATKVTGGRTRSRLQPVSIHNYRPNYNWNRGGRVKELRIRNIARKFLYIWMRKVYGRLNPCVVRAHYNQKLVKQVFSEWYNTWWTNVKEWRLTVRAECQHRYTLWNKVFQAWKVFVKLNKAKRSKLMYADKHASRKLLKQAFSAWKEQHQVRRECTQLKTYAEECYQKNLQRKAWVNWMHQFQIVQQRKQMGVVSLQFWAYRIQIQHWLRWRHAYQERVAESYRLERAHQVYHNGLMLNTFHSLLAYTQVRQFKQSRKAFAEKMYNSNLKDRCLSHWYERFRLRRSMAEHQHKMVVLARQFTLRNTFIRWKHYISLRHEEREKEYTADVHYLKHLLLLGLNGLRLGRVRRRIKETRQQMALNFHYRQILRQTWNKWLSKCEESEDLQLLPQTQAAKNHYRLHMLKKSWRVLVEYKLHRQHKQSLWAKAEAYFYWKSLPKYFFRMKVFVQVMKNKQESHLKAEQFRRENLHARFFYQWFAESEKSQNDRMAERMAILHYDEKVRRRFLHLWQKKTEEASEEQEKMVVAAGHYCHSLCQTVLVQWRSNVRELKKGQTNDVKAAQHLYLQRMKTGFKAWKMYHQKRQKKNSKLQVALSHSQHRYYTVVLRQWRMYVTQQQQQKVAADELYKAKCSILMRNVLQTWYRNVQDIHREKESEQRADIHHNSNMLAKVLKTWHRFAAIHAYKKNETLQLVRDGQQAIHRGILKRTFSHWRNAHDACLIFKLKYQQAIEHHQNNVRIRVLQAWKTYCKLSLKKKLLARQAKWFRQTVLQTRSFLCWRQEHHQAMEIQSKTNMALWHWCLTLQRNVLISWWLYTENRKRKKTRQAEALDRRRLRLLKDGATQWLKVSHEFTQMRAKFAAQQHSKSAYDTYQLVQKYALHWKHVVTKRKMLRQTSSGVSDFLQPVERSNIIPSAPVWSLSPVRVPRFEPLSSRDIPQHIDSGSQAIKAARPRPRQPDFLVDSLKREGLLIGSPDHQRYRQSTSESTKENKAQFAEPSNQKNDTVPDPQNQTASDGHREFSNLRQVAQFPVADAQPEVSEKWPKFLIESISSGPKEEKLIKGPNLPRSALTRATATPVNCPKTGRAQTEHLPGYFIAQSVSNNITLITPSAFLTKKDGTPISDSQGNMQPAKLNENPRGDGSSLNTNVQLVGGKGDNKMEKLQRQREIIQIRDQLRQFDEKKKKLKVLRSQWKQLRSWLHDQSITDDSLDDRDCRQMRDELLQIDSEMAPLKAEISQEKPKCEELVRRVQHLLNFQNKG